MIPRQSHRHLSGHSALYHTSSSFQIHIKVTHPCFLPKTTLLLWWVWIRCALKRRHQHILTTEYTFELDQTYLCLALPIKSQLEPWWPLGELYHTRQTLPTEIKAANLLSTVHPLWKKNASSMEKKVWHLYKKGPCCFKRAKHWKAGLMNKCQEVNSFKISFLLK